MRLGPVLFREVCHTIFFKIIIVIIISFICVFDRYPQWGTANAEITVLSVPKSHSYQRFSSRTRKSRH